MINCKNEVTLLEKKLHEKEEEIQEISKQVYFLLINKFKFMKKNYKIKLLNI